MSTDHDLYYVCPDCGFKQQSQARERIRCHRCGRSYQVSAAKQATKQPDEDFGLGFATFSYRDEPADA
ncbi:MAG: hypothetical protein MUP66_02375 [Candidatus Nanohaloarchaeota archaeon QJJ-5]|nr:hypothetical protein [Candidatus Nanohaloarchaeota archaeon QJJ-5]